MDVLIGGLLVAAGLMALAGMSRSGRQVAEKANELVTGDPAEHEPLNVGKELALIALALLLILAAAALGGVLVS